MNFEFTEEQKLFAEAVRKFAHAELEADALKRAHNPRFPCDVAQRMSRQGLLGITIPEADGGQGGSLMDAVIAIEEVAQACPRSADVVQAGNFGADPHLCRIRVAGAEEPVPAPTCWRAEAVISVGMTEPDAGSAVTDLKTSATPDGGHYASTAPRCSPPSARTPTCSSSTCASGRASAASARCSSSATRRASASERRRAS